MSTAPEAKPKAEAKAEQCLGIDKWLWHARFCRTRRLAQIVAAKGNIRLSGQRVENAGTRLRPCDVMALAKGGSVMVIRGLGLGLGVRRGPAKMAQSL